MSVHGMHVWVSCCDCFTLADVEATDEIYSSLKRVLQRDHPASIEIGKVERVDWVLSQGGQGGQGPFAIETIIPQGGDMLYDGQTFAEACIDSGSVLL